MRYSSNKDDPGYAAFMAAIGEGKSVRVFLDGAEQNHCSMADDDLGEVTRCVVDAGGKIQPDPAKPDHIWVETVTGAVRIVVA